MCTNFKMSIKPNKIEDKVARNYLSSYGCNVISSCFVPKLSSHSIPQSIIALKWLQVIWPQILTENQLIEVNK